MAKMSTEILPGLNKHVNWDITFSANNGLETLRLCANGDIYVRGTLLENDKELVDALRRFVEEATRIKKEGGPKGTPSNF